ncbi:MAG: cytochrome c [Candidatus Scalindua sediminis]
MRISKFSQAILMVVFAFLVFKFAIRPPIPSSLLYFYMMIVIFAIFIYVISDTQLLQAFISPIKSILVEEKKKRLRLVIFTVLPIFAAIFTYINVSISVGPPAELRFTHPAPPLQIQFRENLIRIEGLENPLRSDVANFSKYIEEGAVIYFKNCFFCHGDNLDGNGHFAEALNPRPGNFTDPGTIAQLQESYVFWRISKGGRGLPGEGTPWNSAMPAWENILTEEEIWQVIIYIYDAASVKPRRWEELPEKIHQD